MASRRSRRGRRRCRRRRRRGCRRSRTDSLDADILRQGARLNIACTQWHTMLWNSSTRPQHVDSALHPTPRLSLPRFRVTWIIDTDMVRDPPWFTYEFYGVNKNSGYLLMTIKVIVELYRDLVNRSPNCSDRDLLTRDGSKLVHVSFTYLSQSFNFSSRVGCVLFN